MDDGNQLEIGLSLFFLFATLPSAFFFRRCSCFTEPKQGWCCASRVGARGVTPVTRAQKESAKSNAKRERVPSKTKRVKRRRSLTKISHRQRRRKKLPPPPFPPAAWGKRGDRGLSPAHSMSSTMPASASDDPIGARAALRGLLELRSALLVVDGGLLRAGEPADVSGEGGRSSSCFRAWEEALVAEVQVRSNASQKGRERKTREGERKRGRREGSIA